MTLTDTEAGPHPTDTHVGLRVRELRRQIGMSQGGLADRLHITFQQVQKYERGANRISASRLLDIGQILGVSVAYFFTGIEPGNTERAQVDLRTETFLHDLRMQAVAQRLEPLPFHQREKALAAIVCLVEAIRAVAEPTGLGQIEDREPVGSSVSTTGSAAR